MMEKIRCGTRGSQLALAQTQLVSDALHRAHPRMKAERHEVRTLGDRKQGTVQASFSDKKDWVYDLELALLNQQIDVAVHSGKDIPYEIERGTALVPVLKRANPCDAFIGRKISDGGKRLQLADLPPGAKVGTASLRRQAFLLQKRPDLVVVEHRGNVNTRLQKMEDSPDIMGIILASAGLDRLGIPGLKYETFSPQEMLPALNQGTLVVQFRADDQAVKDVLQSIVDRETHAAWLAERTVAEILKGDCKSAIGIFAVCEGEKILLFATVMLPNGAESVSAADCAHLGEAAALGKRVGERLIDLGAQAIIEKSRRF